MQRKNLPLRRRVLRLTLKVAWISVLLLFILWLRVFYGSVEDYKTGETLLNENQTVRAITYFDRSLHWYAPLNPYVDRSAKRLWEIGERAEQDKDTRLALIAYESIRNGFYGASSFFRPGQEWVQRAESKIQTFSTLRGNKEAVTALKDPQPAVLWSTVVVFGFLGWIGSLAGFILGVFGKEKRSGGNVRRAVLWIGLTTIFFGLWILGMALA
jgi:hypothetical protein